MEEEELQFHNSEPNNALSYSAPLYLYYTNPSTILDPTDDFSGFKFEPCHETETAPDTTSNNTSFADELFHSGVLLPLKLPPRLQNFEKSSSGPTSPNTSSFFRSSFTRTNRSKNRDFDPFTVALQKIRKEEIYKRRQEFQPPRRSRSLSPLRNINWVNSREKEVHKSNTNTNTNTNTSTNTNTNRDVVLQSDDEKRIGTRESDTLTGKSMSRKRKQIVLKMIKPSNVKYKPGLFACFGFSTQ